MKNTKKINFIHYGFIVLALCFSLVLSAFAFNGNVALADGNAEIEIVHIGDEINADEYEITHGGAKITAESMQVVYPTGGIYGGKGFKILTPGKYTVTYSATAGDEKVEETKVYMAVRQPKDLIITEEGMVINQGDYYIESEYELKKNLYGAIVDFKAGQSITFATKIKTENLTQDYDIFDLIVMPSVFGETDFERLTVRVSDLNDSHNFVEVVIDSSNTVDGNGQVSYVRAGANGQQYGGYENATFHSGPPYGTQIEHSFRGLGRVDDYRENVTVSENSITFAIDHAERKVYCGPLGNVETSKLLVNDLDDPAHYKGNPWNGFTSDEVEVKITASSFSKSIGKVLIRKFGDYDFTKDDVIDEIAPQIIVDYDFSQKTPVAEVGSSFPIFAFSCKDNLDEQVITKVLVNYIDDLGNKINVATDGKSFVPKYEGNYEIIYKATDYSDNEQIKVVNIKAVKSSPNVFISIVNDEINAKVFDVVSIPLASEIGVYGGSGVLKVERTVIAPDDSVLDVKDKLQLTMVGDYKVAFTVTDYLGRVEYGAITIRSNELDKPTFIKNPEFPEALIQGFTYEIPKAFVVETIDGKVVELECQVVVNGEVVEDSFQAMAEDGSDTINICYLVVGETGSAEWEVFLPVIDTNYGQLKSKYFYSNDGLEIVDEQNSLRIDVSKDSSASFINSLSAQSFNVSFSYDPANIHFTDMQFVLKDAENASISVTIPFTFDANAWFIKLNGSDKKTVFATSQNIFTFSYNYEKRKIIDTSGIEIDALTICDDGEPFTGFSSKIYFEIAFGGVTEGKVSHIDISQICNQSMGYSMAVLEDGLDEIEPVIILDEKIITRQKLNDKAIIPTAKAFDVLGQISKFTVTVSLGTEVLAKGPADKPVDVLLSKAGNYKVTYSAVDSNGNPKTINYMIRVNDETAPTLTVENKLSKEYKVGDTVKLPNYSAVDNGENCYIQVTLIYPNNEMRLLHYSENGKVTSLLDKGSTHYENAFKVDTNSFKVLVKGNYKLRIVAYDEYYNYTVKEVEFKVK